MEIRLAHNLQPDSIVDGPGIRTVIWTQGCTHSCFGCHNPETHNMKGGFKLSVDEICQQLSEIPFQDGITFSGGDPMLQPEPCSEIAKYAKNLGLNVWCYTGFTYEQLLELENKNPKIKAFMDNIDILVDGKFILEQKSLSLKYRGSRNQRIIDVKLSKEKEQVILAPEFIEDVYHQKLYNKEKYMYL